MRNCIGRDTRRLKIWFASEEVIASVKQFEHMSDVTTLSRWVG
jgi:hypothetical protein